MIRDGETSERPRPLLSSGNHVPFPFPWKVTSDGHRNKKRQGAKLCPVEVQAVPSAVFRPQRRACESLFRERRVEPKMRRRSLDTGISFFGVCALLCEKLKVKAIKTQAIKLELLRHDFRVVRHHVCVCVVTS